MLDFKGWKKIAEDKKTVTMEHPKGHKMTVSLKGLPKIHQEAIKRIKMADAGVVPPAEVQPQAYNAPLNQVPQTNAPTVPPQPNPVTPTGEMNAQNALGLSNKAIDLQQKVDEEKGRRMADVQKGYLDRNNQIQQTHDAITNQLWNDHQNVIDAMKNGDIKPNAYVENMSVPQKTLTALGLFLGGLNGAGNNGAVDFLNKQIDRNIDSQKQNFEHKKTIFGAYQDLYGNNNVSYGMARAANLDALNHQADLIAAQLGTPQAAANAALLKSKTIPEINKHILDSAGLLSSVPNGRLGAATQQAATATAPKSPASEYVKSHLKQVASETNSGNMPTMPGAQASSEKEVLEPDESADSGILKSPEEVKAIKEQLFYTPKAKEQMPQIEQQLRQAQQADTVLSQLHSVHSQLAADTKKPDYSYARRHNPLQGVPFLGETLSHALLQPISDNPTNRDYQANRTRIVSDVANAVGPNVPGAEIEHMVDDNLPEIHDSPKMIAQKERNIRIFIKNKLSGNRDLLDYWKLSR